MPSPTRPMAVSTTGRPLVPRDEEARLRAPEVQLAIATADAASVDHDGAVPDQVVLVELADPADDDDAVARRGLLPGTRRRPRDRLGRRPGLGRVVEAVARARELGKHYEPRSFGRGPCDRRDRPAPVRVGRADLGPEADRSHADVGHRPPARIASETRTAAARAPRRVQRPVRQRHGELLPRRRSRRR